MEKVSSKVTSKDGTKIAYERRGSGPPLILVDGATCSRAFGPMPGLAPLLAENFTVYLYDRRGRNESADTPPYAVQREIEDLAALVDAAGGSAFAYGISSGGGLILEAAASGVNLRKLAVYEPPYAIDQNARRPPADSAAQLDRMVAQGRRGDAVDFFMTQIVGLPPEAAAPIHNAPVWPLLESVAHTIAYDVRVMGDYTFPSDRFDSITVPTLAIYGGASPEMMRKSSEAISSTLPNARSHVLPGQTHEVAAEAIAPVLVEFFKGSPMKYKTTIQQSGKNTTGIPVPAEVVDALGAGKRPPVRVTLNGYTYRSSIATVEGAYMISLSSENRAAAGVAGGDQVEVEIELDDQPREVTLPPDLREALDRDPGAKRFFEGLSYSNKQRFVLPIEQAKTPETRQRRIEKAISDLREGRK